MNKKSHSREVKTLAISSQREEKRNKTKNTRLYIYPYMNDMMRCWCGAVNEGRGASECTIWMPDSVRQKKVIDGQTKKNQKKTRKKKAIAHTR